MVYRAMTVLRRSPLGLRLARGTAWSLGSNVVSRLLGLATGIVVARLIGRQAFGVLGIIQSTVSMFGVVAGFGTSAGAAKYVAEFRSNDPERARNFMFLSAFLGATAGLAVASILAGTSAHIARYALDAPELTPLLRIAAAGLFFGALNGAQMGALTGLEAFKTIALIHAAAGALSVAVTVPLVYCWSLRGAVWAGLISSASMCLIGGVCVRMQARKSGVPANSRKRFSDLSVLWHFGVPAVLSGYMVAGVDWACRAILVNTQDGYAELGLFNAANQWRGAVLGVTGVFSSAAFPVLANLWGCRDMGRYRKTVSAALVSQTAASLVLGGAIALCSTWIMTSYGESFSEGATVLVLMMLVVALSSPCSVVGQAILSSGRIWAGFALNALWAVAMVGTAWSLAGFGAVGLAMAYVIAYVVHLLSVGLYFLLFVVKCPRTTEFSS